MLTGVMHQIKRLCESEVIDLSTKKEPVPETVAMAMASASSVDTAAAASLLSSMLPSSSKEMTAAAASPKKLEPVPSISTEGEKPSSPSPRLYA